MKLTLKKLQISLQEQIDVMKTQLQKSKHEEYELHERADSHLLNLDAFRKETDSNFREVRAEIAELKSDVSDLKTSMYELREEMRAGFLAILSYAGRIDKDHEARIKALEAKNPH
ncbi:MAG: hypothetical protein HYX67_00635 [Candidatus Melainabacteria bacterium]|nr:hypothetical protein [Candidatus Melainabacteria bacterium]